MSRRRRWFLLSPLLIVSVLAGTILGMLRGSLPRLDGELQLPGLENAAVVSRDTLGTPTVQATSRVDVARVTGFLHAQDRFFQMDLLRRTGAGELAELLGPAALSADRHLRVHRFRSLAEQCYRDAAPAERAVVDAYSAGVNAGLDRLRARPFEYWLLQSKPKPWNPEDCFLVVLAMFFDLQEERGRTDRVRGILRDNLPPSLAALFLAPGSRWDAPLVGDAFEPPPLPSPGEFRARSSSRHIVGEREADLGSNAFAVAGDRSRHGGAILACDMHLGLRVPNIWYRMAWRWSADDERHRADGLSLPGAPAIVVGSNGHIAWGFTNGYADATDLIELVDANADGYRGPNGVETFTRFDEILRVRGAEPETLKIDWTRFGPKVSDDPPLAVQWIAQQPAAVNLQLLRLEMARNVDDAVQVFQSAGIPVLNAVIADAEGEIAWTYAGRLPRREGPGDFPRRSDDPHVQWGGLLAPSEMPTVIRPAEGLLWSANARAVCCDELTRVGDGGYSLGVRASQIRDALRQREQHDERALLAIQMDDRAFFLSRWAELLARVGDAEVARYAREDAARASVDAVGYRLVDAFRDEVSERLIGAWLDEIADTKGLDPAYLLPVIEESIWRCIVEEPDHMLPAGETSWTAFLQDCAADVRARAEPLAEWSWGERNRLQMRHPLSSAVPLLSRWLDMPPTPLPGDRLMPRVQSPTFGASERLVVSPGRESEGLLQVPAGVSGHPLSPFYRSGHEAWLRGEPAPLLPGPERHRLELTP